MSLNNEWKLLKNVASTQNVLMTVADIIRFYERGRININPAYQRNYRWSNVQKTKFIESLLLNYPIPPIITIKTENDDGLFNYEIIDGVQRLSTIFEFVGAKNKKGELIKNTNETLNKLCGANQFIEINDKDWGEFKEEDFDFIFDSSSIMFCNLTTENEEVKYEIFERLNSLSSKLSPQEIRNSIIALKDKDNFVMISDKVYSLSKDVFSKNDLGKRIDLEYFVEFSLIKRYEQYKDSIKRDIDKQIELKSKDKDKHYDLLMTTYVRKADISEMITDLADYEEFLQLNKGLNFGRYDIDKAKFIKPPIKFYFELLGFIFFKNKKLINEGFYKTNFCYTYGYVVKNFLRMNNPNAKVRFEKANNIIKEYENGSLFNI